jgi:protein gp37
MAEHTAIPWCDHTFNPWWGCEKVSPGCAHCYAETLANRFHEGLWGLGHSFRFFSDKHWAAPLAWNRKAEAEGVRKRVFCASMADVFEEREELEEHRQRLFALINATPQLDWLLLTKREQAMQDWFAAYYDRPAPTGHTTDPPLPNLWLGVTIENAHYTYRADILREIPAAVRFISAEPLLGNLFANSRPSFVRPGESKPWPSTLVPLDLTGIDWLIAGAESGPKARPMDEEWVRELRDTSLTTRPGCSGDDCAGIGDGPMCPTCGGESESGTAFFYKQAIAAGRKVECPELDGRQWMEFPA